MDLLYNDNLNPITDGQSETHTPYGVFRTHNAICVGNTTTFKLFMDALGIPCKIIHSTENGEHAWDVVQLDGDWYHVDVTFDGSANGVPSYSYFNVPDSMKDDGSWALGSQSDPGSERYEVLLSLYKRCCRGRFLWDSGGTARKNR